MTIHFMSFGGHGHRMNRLIKLLLLDILSCGAVSSTEWSSLIQFLKGKVFKQSPEMTRKIVFKLSSANRFKNSILQQSLKQTSPLVTFTMVSQMRRYQVILD